MDPENKTGFEGVTKASTLNKRAQERESSSD
jgi:hypothetical protein